MMSLILFTFLIIIKSLLKDIKKDMKQWTLADRPTIFPFNIASVVKLKTTSAIGEHFKFNQYGNYMQAQYNILEMKSK